MLLIVLGVLLAAVVGGGVYILAQRATTDVAEETAKVVVVVAPIAERTLIPSTSIGLADVPARLIPTGAIRRIEDAAGKMSIDAMYPGEFVLANRVADTSGKAGLSYALEEGTVVITFPTSDIVSTGAIKAGDHVDILITLDTFAENPAAAQPGTTASPSGTTQMTLQNLRVLSIGSVETAVPGAEQQAGQQNASLITFAVPREDALTLKNIKDHPSAKIDLVLRPAGDEQVYTTDAVHMRSLIERFRINVP